MSSEVLLSRHDNQARGIGHYAIDFMAAGSAIRTRRCSPRSSSSISTRSPAASRHWPAGPTRRRCLRQEALEYAAPPGQGVPLFGSRAAVMPEKAVRGQQLGGARVGRQRHELRLQPGPRGHARRVRPQRLLSRGRRRRPASRARRPADPAGDDPGRRDPRTPGRGLPAEKLQDRPRRPRRDRLGRHLSAPCWARRPSRSNRPSGWSWPITFRFARSAPASSFPIPRALRPRSAPRRPCCRCAARCAASSGRPTFSATPRRSSACSRSRPTKAPARSTWPCRPSGDDFAVMGMHFKLGLYEHQSAGAIQGLMDLLAAHPRLLDDAGQAAPHRNHDLRAGLRHHRRPGQARSAHPAERRPLDGLHHRHPVAQGVSNNTARAGAS